MPGATTQLADTPEMGWNLDPELRSFAHHPAGRLHDVQAARREVAAAMRRAQAHPIACRDVCIEETMVPDADSPGTIPVRLYRPVAQKDAPILVYFHGGAFVLGSPELEDPGCVRYARQVGCIVVSVDYRLAPEYPFPAGLEDCYAALTWAGRCAGEFGGDTERIAVGGASAGGALAAAVALMARDRNGPKPVLQLLVYPVLDDSMGTPSMRSASDTPVFANGTAADMWRLYLGDSAAEPTGYAAPARAANLSGLPPAYIEACELDPLLDENVEYAARLRQAGVPAELHIVAGAPHGFDQFYLGAPGPLSWPMPVGDAPAIAGLSDELDPDFARMPRLTQRMVKKRIVALRNAFHPVEHGMEDNGPVRHCNV